MAHPYRTLLRTPHVPSLLILSMVARIPMAGVPIAVTFLVAGWTGSYGLAGAVVGGLTIGTAIAGPVRGRMVDRGRSDRVMLVSAVAYASGLTALALLPASVWWVSLPLGLATGLFAPPSNQIVRSVWPRILQGPARQTIYSVEGAVQEILFIAGPLIAAGTVAVASPRVATLTLAGIAVAGGVAFALSVRAAGMAEPAPAPAIPHASKGKTSLLAQRPVLLLIGFFLLLVSGIGAIDLAIVAVARESGAAAWAGALAAVWALGSLAGGLAVGAMARAPGIRARAAASAVGLLLLVPLMPPIVDLPSLWWLTPVLFLAGLGIAPTMGACMSLLSELSPDERRGEAFGWMNTAGSTGMAVAAPVTGALIDWGGVAAGVAGGAGMVVVAALFTVFLPRSTARSTEETGSPSTGRPEPEPTEQRTGEG
ncbi:MFS transporter [Spiractinospora alimapuensis]|uniref:MFS transporter n=1 Tax=Spiractinospora alimapuensis TaxID=2820884 RepID=UPI001F439BA7|nr:MFS transporter [Spiractinospora alimapuensis]